MKNYIHGWSTLSQLGYEKPKRGQNLQISNIGISYYSETKKENFYNLAISSNFSEHSTIEKMTYIGNSNELNEIQIGDIIFSARGVQFGRCIVFPETIQRTITNIDSLVIKSVGKIVQSIFVTMILNAYRQNKYIYGIAITGSGANSLTQYQVDDIPFPNFPQQKQEQIAKLYYNSNVTFDSSKCTLDDFETYDNTFNTTAGIYELDKTAKILKERLNQVIDSIVNDEDVNISFDL